MEGEPRKEERSLESEIAEGMARHLLQMEAEITLFSQAWHHIYNEEQRRFTAVNIDLPMTVSHAVEASRQNFQEAVQGMEEDRHWRGQVSARITAQAQQIRAERGITGEPQTKRKDQGYGR